MFDHLCRTRRMSLQLLVGFLVASAVSVSAKLSAIHSILIVQDIQCNIWHHLTWEERLLFRQVSSCCHMMHHHLFPLEYDAITKCKALSLCIHAIDPHELKSFFASRGNIRCLEPAILAQEVLQPHESMLIEKIMVDITERALCFEDASRACILWLNSNTASSPGFDGHGLQSSRWPTMDHNGFVIPYNRNLDKLHRMFQMAKNEMARTKSKYNRYTRFAFVFLDAFLMSLDEKERRALNFDENVVTNMVRHLWCGIVSVEFISDYLLRPRLRDFGEPVAAAIEFIMADAVQLNGTLNTNRLLLMVNHPDILFNFNIIFFDLIESRNWNQEKRTECLEFIVDHGLMTWSVMNEYLRDYRTVYFENPVIYWMWRYVQSRHLKERLEMSYSQNPLLRTGAYRNHSFRIPESFRKIGKNHGCCRCM